MKRFFFATMILCLLTPSFQASATGKKKDCAKCAEIKNLEIEASKLDYFNRRDYAKGSGYATKAYALFVKYTETIGNQANAEEFNALIAMVSAVSPYDVESVLAASLAAAIDDSPEYKRLYREYLSTTPDSCYKKDLSAYVEGYLCSYAYEKKRKKGDPEDNPACTATFSIGACLKDEKNKNSKSELKSSNGQTLADDGAGLFSCVLGNCPTKGLNHIGQVN